MDWLKESDEIDVLAEDDLDIMQERGGSDYSSFYEALAKQYKDNRDFRRIALLALKLPEELCGISYSIENMPNKAIQSINKRSEKIFKALFGLTKDYYWQESGFVKVLSDIDKRQRNSGLGYMIDDLGDSFAQDMEIHTDDPQVLINMILAKMSNIVNTGKRNYDELERQLDKIDDHGFKANKAAIISNLQKEKRKDVDVANKVLSLVKQEWPNGLQSQKH